MDILSPATNGTDVTAATVAATAPVAANIMPSYQQTAHGVEPTSPGNPPRPYKPFAPEQVIWHPRQAPSAVTSEQFFSARNMMAPGFMNNAAATKIARISNLQADAPRYSGQIDILA